VPACARLPLPAVRAPLPTNAGLHGEWEQSQERFCTRPAPQGRGSKEEPNLTRAATAGRAKAAAAVHIAAAILQGLFRRRGMNRQPAGGGPGPA
jgi:hypothetical protein